LPNVRPCTAALTGKPGLEARTSEEPSSLREAPLKRCSAPFSNLKRTAVAAIGPLTDATAGLEEGQVVPRGRGASVRASEIEVPTSARSHPDRCTSYSRTPAPAALSARHWRPPGVGTGVGARSRSLEYDCQRTLRSAAAWAPATRWVRPCPARWEIGSGWIGWRVRCPRVARVCCRHQP
jgi:hypothetical protein